MCLPMPPSWPEVRDLDFLNGAYINLFIIVPYINLFVIGHGFKNQVLRLEDICK